MDDLAVRFVVLCVVCKLLLFVLFRFVWYSGGMVCKRQCRLVVRT